MRIRTFCLCASLTLALTPSLQAQLCAVDETPTLSACKEKVLVELASTKAPSAKLVDAGAAAEPTQKAVGELASHLSSKLPPQIATLPGTSATIEDFLSRLKISATTTEPGDDGGTALAVELTDFLGLPTDDGYKVQAVLRPPKLFNDLADDLANDVAEAKSNDLNSFDDVLVTFSYAPTVGGLGRVDAVLSDAITRNLGALRKEFFGLQVEFGQSREVLVGRIQEASLTVPDEDVEMVALDDADLLTAERANQILGSAEAFYRADEILRQETSKLLRGSPFFLLADLVANQPQLVFNVSHSFRDSLVGPEETMAKVTYEMGFVNLNGLKRHTRKRCGENTPELACLDSFLTPGRRTRLQKANRGDRLAFSLEWARRDAHDVAVGDVMIDLDRRERWTGSLAFGRNLRVEDDGTATLRADLTGSYEDWSDDPMRQDRGLVKLALTQRITDDTSMVVGAVWATKPEFRGEVDKEVTARFGFTYSLDKKDKKK